MERAAWSHQKGPVNLNSYGKRILVFYSKVKSDFVSEIIPAPPPPPEIPKYLSDDTPKYWISVIGI